MITFSLNTFIKVCMLDTGSRISELQRRLSGASGYDYYKPLQNAIRAHCISNNLKVEKILASPTNATERKYNQEAFEGFYNKFGTNKTIKPIRTTRYIKSPNKIIRIAVQPLFETSKDGI